MEQLTLFKVVLGCRPKGRNTEQHDVFFSIGRSLVDFQKDLFSFWPRAKETLHVDTWQKVTHIEGYKVLIVPRKERIPQQRKLFFVNTGSYRPGYDREDHHSIFVAAETVAEASKQAKATKIFRQLQMDGFSRGKAATHLDDKFGVDDIFDIERRLPKKVFRKYSIYLQEKEPGEIIPVDEVHITGFTRVDQLHL